MSKAVVTLPAHCPATEFSPAFVELMVNRMSVSFHKYGPVAAGFPARVDALESLKDRLKKYAETGNTEWLVDAANFCMVPETRVLMRDLSYRPLGELKVGDELVGFTEDPVTRRTQRAWRQSRVVSVRRVDLPCCRVTLANGVTMTASTDHRWFTSMQQGPGWQYGWLETGRDERSGLRQHGRHFLPRIAPVELPGQTYDDGWVAGFLDGEGHANQKGGRVGSLKVVWGSGSTCCRPGPSTGTTRRSGPRTSTTPRTTWT